MKHLSGYDNIFETEAWYFWGNMKVLLGHSDWELGTKGLHSEPADKNFLGLCIVSNVSKWWNFLLFSIENCFTFYKLKHKLLEKNWKYLQQDKT